MTDVAAHLPEPPKVGVVVIGRNEGQRLLRCLKSARSSPAVVALVYVDSGSTDHSVQQARAFGEVVELDRSMPFTAARARNAGLARLLSHASLEYVQFIDGDCELDRGWIQYASAFLAATPNAAVVCGRRRERYPDSSVYNLLCDLEWDTPVGQAEACGGDALMRIEPLRQIGGFRSDLIAGEEPELCVRLRQEGWTIHRLDREMTLHDADMTCFSQWWKRNTRAGFAFAEGAALHGQSLQKHWVRQSRSNWVWGFIVPVIALLFAWPTWGASLLLFAAYLCLGWRVRRYAITRGWSGEHASLYARFVVFSKLPMAIGQGQYWFNRLLGLRSTLIEYKGAARPVG